MNIDHDHKVTNKKIYPKGSAALLVVPTTIAFLILTSSMTGIFYSSPQLVFAQNETVTSENLWGEDVNVTSGKEIPGQKIYTFLNGSMPKEDISTLAAQAESGGIEVVEVIPEAGIIIVNESEGEVSPLADAGENANSLVATEPNRQVTVDSQSIPTGVDRIDAERPQASSSASESNTTSAGNDPVNATIGILDTGIDLDNPDLNVVENVSFVDWFSRSGDDVYGHGTHVAGIAAAKDNGMGVVGVAPGARLISIKVLNDIGSGTTQDILQGLAYVLENPDKFDVINLSLGQTGVSSALNNMISEIVDAGVPVVVSAGNSNLSARYHSPASAEDAITVSATYDGDGKCGALGPSYERGEQTITDDSFAPYSNHGEIVDIMAPGTLINSTIPGGGFEEKSGTSMAAPHVAGAIALYKSVFPDAPPSEIADIINGRALYVGDSCDSIQENGRGFINDWKDDDDDAEEPHLYSGTLQ